MDEKAVRKSFDATVDGRLVGFFPKDKDRSLLGKTRVKAKGRSIVDGFHSVMSNMQEIHIKKK